MPHATTRVLLPPLLTAGMTECGGSAEPSAGFHAANCVGQFERQPDAYFDGEPEADVSFTSVFSSPPAGLPPCE